MVVLLILLAGCDRSNTAARGVPRRARPAVSDTRAGKLPVAPEVPTRSTAAPGNPDPGSPSLGVPSSRPAKLLTPAGLRCLLAAYPKQLCGARANTLIWCDGTRMKYDDGKQRRDHKQLLDEADLQDQMAMTYTPGKKLTVPAENFEPGRVRHEPLFKKMYGASSKAVTRGLTRIRWLPGIANRTVSITTVNDVHLKLRRVSAELGKLPRSMHRYLRQTAGTFNWRLISGTRRLSMHSFGVAIDISLAHSDYWRWAKRGPNGKLRYRNRVPLEIVEIFERHGFIWGGRWYHYDTMHFEYRPELLAAPCVGK